MKPTILPKEALLSKSKEELTSHLELEFGYSVGSEELSEDSLRKLITDFQANREQKNSSKFSFLEHLKDYVPMTEKMITDAFYSSSRSFLENYLSEVSLEEDKKKEVFYEIRDIVINNQLSVLRPNQTISASTSAKKVAPKPAPKIVKEQSIEKRAVETTEETSSIKEPEDSLEPENAVEQQAPIDTKLTVDISTLKKKGDKVEYIIDELIERGTEILSLKPVMVMDRFVELFDDSVSDGYAYDKIAIRKKAFKASQNES